MYQNRTKPDLVKGFQGEGELQMIFLGMPQVCRDGLPVPRFVYKKSLALLSYLAVTGKPQSRVKLSGLLWGEIVEVNSRANLRKVLADLDRVVGPNLIITRQEITLNRECAYWLDVEAFERQVSKTLNKQHIPLVDEDVVHLREAVELYQGDFMDGFYVHRAQTFDEWTLLERQRMWMLALKALQALSAYYTVQRSYSQGIQYTNRLLALDPLQEEGHRQMMTLLTHSGQKGAALRQYDVCRRVFAEELDLAPSDETKALYERIRAGVTYNTSIPTAPNNLPVHLTPLLCREAELAEITRQLEDPACRLLTLVGPGGIGKTRLAQEAAAAQLDHFEHGVYWVSLASLQSTEAILPAIAQALDLSCYKQGTHRQQVFDYLSKKSVLLVLDSFEHMLDGADQVIDILKTAPKVKLLITSRFQLNMQSEYLLPIAGLDCTVLSQLGGIDTILRKQKKSFSPTLGASTTSALLQDLPLDLKDAAEYGSVKLFTFGVCRVQPDFKATTDELMDVVRICRLLQGIPLTLLFAAAWAKILTPAEILAQLSGGGSDSLDFLAADWPDIPPRHRSIRAVFDQSWNLLTEREREVFSALSVFHGDFTREAAQYVSGASLRELIALVNKSMLHRTPKGGFEICEMLRRYAAEKLEQTPTSNADAWDRQNLYFAKVQQK